MRVFLASVRRDVGPSLRRGVRLGAFVATGLGAITGMATCSAEGVQFQELLSTDLKGLKKVHSGRVRDVYEVDNSTLLQVATDRLIGFDAPLLSGVPSKGKILTQLAVWWFEIVDKEIFAIPHHLLTSDVDKMPPEVQQHAGVIRGRCMLVKKLDMLPMGFVVRGFLSGPCLQEYYKTGKVGGKSLPLGLTDGAKIPNPLFVAWTKTTDGRTEDLNFDQCVEKLGFTKTAEIASKSMRIYERARRLALAKGIILADAEFEFGVDNTGALVLAGEIFTPDTSSFWDLNSYKPGRPQERVDRQIVRDYLLSIKSAKTTPVTLPDTVAYAAMNKYADIFLELTGHFPDP